MASIFLIRHAQASFGTGDYDRLSALGLQQARIAGEYLGVAAAPITRIVAGPLRRQRETAAEIAATCTRYEAMRRQSRPTPGSMSSASTSTSPAWDRPSMIRAESSLPISPEPRAPLAPIRESFDAYSRTGSTCPPTPSRRPGLHSQRGRAPSYATSRHGTPAEELPWL